MIWSLAEVTKVSAVDTGADVLVAAISDGNGFRRATLRTSFWSGCASWTYRRSRMPSRAAMSAAPVPTLRDDKTPTQYGRRKGIAEPVFGQIKQALGLRRFSLRGLAKVASECGFVCLCHNVLKLYRAAGARPALAS
jgi:hypothetical protein